jgi:hypothetical protein
MAESALPDQPAIPTPPTERASRHTLWFLVALYTLAIAWGVRNIHFWEPSRMDGVFPVALAIALGWWAIVDARRRRHPIPLLTRPWFFLVAGLLVPGYVIWSRRWNGLGWLALNGVLWYAVATVVMHVGGWLVFGDEWLRALGM